MVAMHDQSKVEEITAAARREGTEQNHKDFERVRWSKEYSSNTMAESSRMTQ